MIIRIALLLTVAAFTVLISVEALMWLAAPGLLKLMTQLGLAILLTAFAVLLITGLLNALKLILQNCRTYFSTQQRKQRKLLFMQGKEEQIRQLFYFRAAQINYFHNLKRKRLLNSNNRRNIRQLSKIIDKELLSVKKQLPPPTFKQLQQENSRYRNRQDSAALLELQKRITLLR